MTDFIKQILPKDMSNDEYSILIRPYAFGQYRIQLTNVTRPALGAPEGHGDIVREMCTYKADTMREVTKGLAAAGDPEAYCETLVRPYNCEYKGGRIRLDNRPDDRPEYKDEEGNNDGSLTTH